MLLVLSPLSLTLLAILAALAPSCKISPEESLIKLWLPVSSNERYFLHVMMIIELLMSK